MKKSQNLEIAEYGIKALAASLRAHDEANLADTVDLPELAELLDHFASLVAAGSEDLRTEINGLRATSGRDEIARVS